MVAGITTPAWTPLFPLAAAVVTDIGGPLSHGSIVAREYGIPAVMGTGVATKRIQTDLMNDAAATGAETLVTACPKCLIHLSCAQRGQETDRNRADVAVSP